METPPCTETDTMESSGSATTEESDASSGPEAGQEGHLTTRIHIASPPPMDAWSEEKGYEVKLATSDSEDRGTADGGVTLYQFQKKEDHQCSNDSPMPNGVRQPQHYQNAAATPQVGSVDHSPTTRTRTPQTLCPEQCKEKGNQAFKSKHFAESVRLYSLGLETLLHDHANPTTPMKSSPSLEVQLRSNLALALIKLQRYEEAEHHCTASLEIQPTNAKTLYRRAQSLECLAAEEVTEDLVDGLHLPNAKHHSLELLARAEHDLKECLSLLNSQAASQSSTNMTEAERKGWTDAQDALQRVQERFSQASNTSCHTHSPLDATDGEPMQSHTLPPTPMQDGTASLSHGSFPCEHSQDQYDDGVPASSIGPPSASQQLEIVMQLLSQRDAFSKSLRNDTLASAVDTRLQPLDGEAYFLINMPWWSAWCRYVDFFLARQSQRQSPTAKAEDGEAMARRLLLPGAAGPQDMQHPGNKRRAESATANASSNSSGDDTDDDDDDDENADGWTGATGYGPMPGVIDNSDLFLTDEHRHNPFYSQYLAAGDAGVDDMQQFQTSLGTVEPAASRTALRPNLVRGFHYELLPREVYGALRCWYGEATFPICRRAASVGGRIRIRLHSDNMTNGESVDASEKENHSCGACYRPGAPARCKQCFSVYYCNRDCQVCHWPFHKAACKSIAAQSLSRRNDAALADAGRSWGRVGLNNLGNTCFMNSALQCLSHATPLTRHFLTNQFRSDLNSSNPLGNGGKLALAYDQTIKALWVGNARYGSTSPVALKRAIALFAPRFAGCAQHDSQEFLAYLLDGLHEDLNRIQNPPYVEMPDVRAGQKFTVAGAEAWHAYCRRNDSLVMDAFYGQFKSTCVCPKCENVSVSFDAFNHVSLEIPNQNATRTIPVLLFSREDGHGFLSSPLPVRYAVTVSRTGRVGDMKRELSLLSGVPSDRLYLCDIYGHIIYEVLPEDRPVSSIRAEDVMGAYEVDLTHERCVRVMSSHCDVVAAHRGEAEDENGGRFGFPMLASFPGALTCREVWEMFWDHTKHNILDGAVEGVDPSIMRIRFVDQNGHGRAIVAGVSNGNVDAATLLPLSEEPFVGIFNIDLSREILFFSLEWADKVRVYGQDVAVLDKRRFLNGTDHPSMEQARRRQNSVHHVTLDDCFDAFTRPERLDANNTWYCSRCKAHVRAMKTMELWRLPNVLVVHLKRFEFKNSLRREKLDTLVKFPMDGLDMSKHCASSCRYRGSDVKRAANGGDTESPSDVVLHDIPACYDLFGVVNHFGRMGFGHYTAFARNWDEKGMDADWALFDDSRVHEVGDGFAEQGGHGVCSNAAYVLFYRRRIFS